MRLRSPGPVPVCRLVAGGGHLYDCRVRRCRIQACCVFGLQGFPVCGSCVPVPCRVMTPGGAGPAAVAEPAGQGTGWAGGQRNRSRPGRPWPAHVLLSVACLEASGALRTCSGRRRPGTPPRTVHMCWSAAFDSGRRRAVCKTVGSAYVGSNPTPATTSGNGPLAAETRPRGPFSSCHAVYQRCVTVSRCVAVSTDA